MWRKKLNVFWSDHWVKLIWLLVLVVSIAFPWWILSMLDVYQRVNMLAYISIMPLLSIIQSVIFVYLIVKFQYGGGFNKMQKSSVKSKDVKVKWDDVIGMVQAKIEALELVNLIKDHARVKKIGGKMLRGILMMGPPGCGKTYLAKAIATEAGVPFLSVSGAEFVEMFVGVGASRVRQLFKQARKLAYANGGCIVFIDEIDSVARRRILSAFGGTEETNSTQNQLLAEMDGLGEKIENVVVIGATNAPESSLDEALLRPGRFDRKIFVQRPDAAEREAIFKYYFGKVKVDPALDAGRIARRAMMKTPSDIANIVQEAALISTRDGKETIDYKDIMTAMDRIDLGFKHRLKMTQREKANVAYHEAGHAIAIHYLHPEDEANYATIISRSGSLGHVQYLPTEEFYTSDKEVLLADVKASVAGFAAEKVKFGVTTNGVSADFSHAMRVAFLMVWRVGMGESGLMGDFQAVESEDLSDDIKQKLNRDTQKILDDCLQEVEILLKRESVVFEKFAQELLTKEELDYDQIQAIFKDYGTSTPRKLREHHKTLA